MVIVVIPYPKHKPVTALILLPDSTSKFVLLRELEVMSHNRILLLEQNEH